MIIMNSMQIFIRVHIFNHIIFLLFTSFLLCFSRMQLVPLSLLHLQRLLDTGRVDPKHLIDLTSIVLTSTLTYDILMLIVYDPH